MVNLRYMENTIPISKINDFIFCPRSLYFHSLYENYQEKTYHDLPQRIGKAKHENIDQGRYSTSHHIIQGIEVYSSNYGLGGKIDIYDSQKQFLIERKYKVKHIFDGYKYQLFAQYFCMIEMGYEVKKLFIHSLSDNKRYEISLPCQTDKEQFLSVIQKIKDFNPLVKHKKAIANKCNNCIYKELCG